MASTFEGGCDCRHVRYRLMRTPLFVHCCHCRWCQRETGSAFVLNALIETEGVELLRGAPAKVMTPSERVVARTSRVVRVAGSRSGATIPARVR